MTEMEEDSHASCQPSPIPSVMLHQFPGLSKSIRGSSMLGKKKKKKKPTAGGIADVKLVYTLLGVQFRSIPPTPHLSPASTLCFH